MSPIINSPPLRGYADWQRVGNFDIGDLWSVNKPSNNSSATSPILDVSRVAYLGGQMHTVASSCQVLINWFTDTAGTNLVGSRLFLMDSGISNPAFIRIPNLGPFCQVTASGLLGGVFAFVAEIFGTNRVHPLEFIPQQPLLVNRIGIAINNGVRDTFYGGDYYNGPAMMYVTVANANMEVAIESLTTSAVYNNEWVNPALVTGQLAVIVAIPSGAYRFHVTNSSGVASSYSFVVTQSYTGAI